MKRSSIKSRLILSTLALIALASASHLHGYVPVGRTWGSNTVYYYVNPQNVHVSEQAAIGAVQAAAAGWGEQSRANIRLQYAGTTGGSSLAMNYKNEVFFRNDASPAGNVAEAWYWWD